jgi:hypothetical protein
MNANTFDYQDFKYIDNSLAKEVTNSTTGGFKVRLLHSLKKFLLKSTALLISYSLCLFLIFILSAVFVYRKILFSRN